MKNHISCKLFKAKKPYKHNLIKRLTLFFLIVSIFKIQAKTNSGNTEIGLDMEEVTVREILHNIETLSKFSFLYNNKNIDGNREMSVRVKRTISEILKSKPFGAETRFKDSENPSKIKNSEKQRTITVTGTITETDTEMPVPAANILEKGTSNGVMSDFDGNFSIDVPTNAILKVSYIGYATKEINVNGRSEIDIVLEQDAAALDEVVVVGYGTQKKVNLTGAVSQISSEMLENRPVTNIGQALQGTIPNLNISFGDGKPNTNPSYNVRGGTSFSGGSFLSGSPLILIDGVEADMNLLNPEDIESISVLKDAASAAIYGARAANGVVLVTTKKGKKGEPTSVSYSHSFQMNSPSYTPDLLDARTIQDANIKAEELEGRTASSNMLEKLDRIEQYMNNPGTEKPYYMDPGDNIIWIANTRVYDAAVRDITPISKHNLSVSGGSEKDSYYASIGFQDQEGLYKINTDKFKRYNFLLNLGSQVSDWLELDYGVQYNNSIYTEPASPSAKGGWWTAMSQEPFRNVNMPLKTPADSPVGVMYTDNILSFMDYGAENKERKELLLLNVAPTITLLEDWQIKGTFSYKSYNFRRKQIVPELLRIDKRWDTPINHHTSPSYIQKWNTHTDQFTLNLFTDYTLNVDKHKIYGLAGFNQEWYKYEQLGGKGENILSPNIPVINQTLGNEFANDGESHWALRGGFYRIKYNFDDRYLVESNGRYDGTSRFPKDRRFKFFPSVSAAWRFSEENFADFIKPAFDELKFRASYGSLGNQDVANYIYIPSYGTISQVNHLFNGSRPIGITPPGLVDPNLTWETSTTIDFGVDMSLFRKLDFTFDWYRRKTSNILVAGDKFPSVLGTAAPTKNAGEMQTTGWGLTLDWKDQLDNGFRYNIAFNLSDSQSEVTSFDGNPNNLLNGLYEGRKMGEIWGYETAGIFQSREEIENSPSQELLDSRWFPGDVSYKDLNGDGQIGPGANTLDDPGDKRIIGNSSPRYQFGLNMNAFWKSFDLNVFLQGVAKRDYWIGNSMHWGQIVNGNATGTWNVYNNSWTPERTDAFYPAYKTKGANALTQSRYLQNAAYVRLKNVALGFSFPDEVIEKLRMTKLRLSLSGYNVLEITDIPKSFDPEEMNPNYPLMRSLAVGVQVTF